MSRTWLLAVPVEVFESERLYANAALRVPTGDAEPGDRVAVTVAGGPLFAFGEVAPGRVRYTRRLFDEPVEWEEPPSTSTSGELAPLDPATFAELDRLANGAAPQAKTPGPAWLVSLALPIEASTPGEAVREFWSYVAKLGPRELPAFVSPARDELAMRAYVLGAETELDPEEAE